MTRSGSAIERVDRWMKQSGDIQERVLTALDSLPIDALRELAKLYIESVGYLGEHLPHERESVAPFACSGTTYHYCSFMGEHDPGCPAVGGDGTLTGQYKNAVPCAPDCGETDERPWCHCSGFDCPDCAMVDSLLGLLEAHGA